MAHTCRGTISLHGAIIHTENASSNFVVSNGGGTQVGPHNVHGAQSLNVKTILTEMQNLFVFLCTIEHL